MPLIDFTIKNNQQIRDYFRGSDSYIPSSELVYLHEHPMIRESFLAEIEALVHTSAECLVTHKVQGALIEKFILSTQKLGALLPEVTKDNAPHILDELRTVYVLCNNLLSNFNFK